MPRSRKPARVIYRASDNAWIIKDGDTYRRTGIRGPGGREAAERALSAYIAERETRPGPSHPHQITVGAVLTLYLTEHAPTTADPARIAYAAKALAPFWSDLTCDKATGATARRYAKERGVSSATARREIGVLNAAFGYAHGEGVLIYPIALPLPAHGQARERWLERHELRALLRVAPTHTRRLLILGALTGTRPGAIMRTRWTPSLSEPWIDLAAGVYHRSGASERRTAKRRGSCRLPAPLVRLLRRWAREGGSHVVMWKGRPISDAGKALDAACAAAGIERITPHDLKRTAVTWFFQRGGTQEDASEFFDTTGPTLERAYRQHSPRYQSRAAEIMGRRR